LERAKNHRGLSQVNKMDSITWSQTVAFTYTLREHTKILHAEDMRS
jgi:hypothetical protein